MRERKKRGGKMTARGGGGTERPCVGGGGGRNRSSFSPTTSEFSNAYPQFTDFVSFLSSVPSCPIRSFYTRCQAGRDSGTSSLTTEHKKNTWFTVPLTRTLFAQ
jgi:hypothetical protein